MAEDLSSRSISGSDICDRCEYSSRQLHPSCTACKRTARAGGPPHPLPPFPLFFSVCAVRWVVRYLVDPLSYFSFQPVFHDWYNKRRGMCYPVCGMMHIKEPLLLIRNSSLSGGSGFLLSISEWSFTICLTPYNSK